MKKTLRTKLLSCAVMMVTATGAQAYTKVCTHSERIHIDGADQFTTTSIYKDSNGTLNAAIHSFGTGATVGGYVKIKNNDIYVYHLVDSTTTTTTDDDNIRRLRELETNGNWKTVADYFNFGEDPAPSIAKIESLNGVTLTPLREYTTRSFRLYRINLQTPDGHAAATGETQAYLVSFQNTNEWELGILSTTDWASKGAKFSDYAQAMKRLPQNTIFGGVVGAVYGTVIDVVGTKGYGKSTLTGIGAITGATGSCIQAVSAVTDARISLTATVDTALYRSWNLTGRIAEDGIPPHTPGAGIRPDDLSAGTPDQIAAWLVSQGLSEELIGWQTRRQTSETTGYGDFIYNGDVTCSLCNPDDQDGW